jgi:hypothetical protein
MIWRLALLALLLVSGPTLAQDQSSSTAPLLVGEPDYAAQLIKDLLRSSARISVNIPRAPIYGDRHVPSSLYCSPWIYVRNSLRLQIRIVELGIHFYDATGREVGASLSTHQSIAPGEIHQRILTQVNHPPCDGLRGVGVVQMCELEDGTDCRQLVNFSEYGFFPLRAAP